MIPYIICLSLFDLLHLAVCAQGPFMLWQTAIFPSFSWLNNNPLCVCVYIFIYLSIDRPLDFSHILAVMNDTAMNMRIQISLKACFCFLWI